MNTTGTRQAWRVTYGSWWEPDVDEGGLTWGQARDKLIAELTKVHAGNDGECSDCTQEAAGALAAVKAAAEGTEIDEEVEGQPYRISRDRG